MTIGLAIFIGLVVAVLLVCLSFSFRDKGYGGGDTFDDGF